MSEAAKAKFEPTDGGAPVSVDFNPATLMVSATNKLQEAQGSGDARPRQQTRVTTTKMEAELVFDTTETGADVRDLTRPLQALAVVTEDGPTTPPRVAFVWGLFRYEGVIESLKEALEFWSAEGVPLRATVQVAMQGVNADGVQEGGPKGATLGRVPEGGFGAAKVATDAGDPKAARRLGAANGLENLRMPTGGALAVGGGVQLQAAAGFRAAAGFSASAGLGASAGIGGGASAGVSFGAGATAGGGASAGFGGGASAGFGGGASAGFGGGASAGFGGGASAGFGAGASARFGGGASAGFGGSASAGASATSGAFAGLGASSRVGGAVRLEPARLLPPAPAAGATFDATGRASAGGPGGLSARIEGSASVGTDGG